MPIEASSGSGDAERTTLTPATIARAARNAPTVVLYPRTKAMAMPGSTPWASASPRKLIPRSTTQVPTSDVHSAVSSTAHNVVRMNSLSVNGATHHAHGSVKKFTSVPDGGRSGRPPVHIRSWAAYGPESASSAAQIDSCSHSSGANASAMAVASKRISSA